MDRNFPLIEFNTINDKYSIFNINIKFKDNDFKSIFNISYNEENDTLQIINSKNNNEYIIYTNQILFENFKEKYGIDFIERFIYYLKWIPNIYIEDNTFEYKDFYYNESTDNTRFRIGKYSNYGDTFIDISLVDKNNKPLIDNRERINILTNCLEVFLSKLKNIMNNTEIKYDNDEDQQKNIFSIVDGYMTIMNRNLIICYAENYTSYSKSSIPIKSIILDENENDNNIYKIITKNNNIFMVTFLDVDNKLKFIDYIKELIN